MRNKEHLRQAILQKLEDELKTATQAADTAKETATSDETVAENKYDTFGLEASYLAHGQSQRAAELLLAIKTYRALPLKEFNQQTAIGIGATVCLEDDQGHCKYLFLGPDAGGLKANWNNKEVMIITAQTPLGKRLNGSYLGDNVELEISGQQICFEIVSVE